MALGFLRGAAAGAAGTTALNAATYLDMAVRGRGSSSAPQNLVQAVADRADVRIPGDWAADAIPHLLYGLVTYATIRAAGDR